MGGTSSSVLLLNSTTPPPTPASTSASSRACECVTPFDVDGFARGRGRRSDASVDGRTDESETWRRVGGGVEVVTDS